MHAFSKHNLQLASSLDANIHMAVSYAELIDLDSIDSILREHLSKKDMREAGSFFTGQEFSSLLVNNFSTKITSKSVVFDPTCGAGNLLIEASRKLPVAASLTSTLIIWGQVLRGIDIHSSFIESAKLRLIIEALSRGTVQDCSIVEAKSYFENIKVGDIRNLEPEFWKDVTHTIANPPFSSWKAGTSALWGQGKVNAAAVVLELILNSVSERSEISALLPDVIRSGTRYEKLRDFVQSKVNAKIVSLGKFNRKTDVDVFSICGRVGKISQVLNWNLSVSMGTNIGDYFDVNVGALVAYRDLTGDTKVPFIDTSVAPPWAEISDTELSKYFDGRLFKAPFVLLRRTSSPSDSYRATGTIVSGNQSIAIENHLLVLKPKDGKLSTCQSLLKKLKTEEVNQFLNQRIRCRHLTVGVVKDIPIKF